MKTNLAKLEVFVPRSTLSVREQCDLVRYEESLGDFIAAGWHHAGEPQKFESNWHIDCLTDHLMAVARREIKGPGPLIFTLPPRHMKSRGVNVFFPAWIWVQGPDPQNEHHGLAVRPDTLMGPGVKFAFVSYIQRLSDDHGESCRRLVQSEWYQRRWGDRVRLNTAQKSYFDNSAGGSRRASSFSSITGFGADIIVVDDAHDIKTVESGKVRDLTLRTWDEVLQTRLNDPKTGIFIAIMQRSHERDLIGHILAKEFDGMHVCLPAEFERNHPHVFVNPKWPVTRTTVTGSGGPAAGEIWEDKRAEGEPLWPDRFPAEVLHERQKSMTSHTVAGQYQQRPTAREGGLFKREWFANPIGHEPYGLIKCRAWDTAGTVAGHGLDPDYTVGVLLGIDPDDDHFYVLDVIRGRWSPGDVEMKIKSTAMCDGEKTRIYYPQAPGAAGKFEAYKMVGELQGYMVSTEREVGDKAYRADSFRGAMPARLCQTARRLVERCLRRRALCVPQRRT